MIYLTGDTHGDFRRVGAFCDIQNTCTDDVLIILGDAGLNYHKPASAAAVKEQVAELPITLLCIHGNHEARPQTIPSYHEAQWRGGTVLVEDDYSNILFAIDGEVFDLDGKQALVIGGAYSVDKEYRLLHGWNWFADEQPSEEIKQRVEQRLTLLGNRVDVVLTHTCPYRYEPREMFLAMIDQATVDASTEKWLDTIESQLDYDAWFCGHWHTEKNIDKLHFLFNSFCMLPSGQSALDPAQDDAFPHNTRLRGSDE